LYLDELGLQDLSAMGSTVGEGAGVKVRRAKKKKKSCRRDATLRADCPLIILGRVARRGRPSPGKKRCCRAGRWIFAPAGGISTTGITGLRSAIGRRTVSINIYLDAYGALEPLLRALFSCYGTGAFECTILSTFHERRPRKFVFMEENSKSIGFLLKYDNMPEQESGYSGTGFSRCARRGKRLCASANYALRKILSMFP
jgi:hypothetical protein